MTLQKKKSISCINSWLSYVLDPEDCTFSDVASHGEVTDIRLNLSTLSPILEVHGRLPEQVFRAAAIFDPSRLGMRSSIYSWRGDVD